MQAHTTERNKNLDNQTLFKIQHIACDEKENNLLFSVLSFY